MEDKLKTVQDCIAAVGVAVANLKVAQAALHAEVDSHVAGVGAQVAADTQVKA